MSANKMYAIVSWWQLPCDGPKRSVVELEPGIEPLARDAPGFVESYWTYERANGKSVGFALLDSADHAHDLRNAIESYMELQDNGALRLEMIRVQEIVAHVVGPGLASEANARHGAPI